MQNFFAVNLRRLRQENKLTQEELARVLGTTKYTISAWELAKQEPSINSILALASFFDMSIDNLLTDSF